MADFDLLVIGAGVIGLATARAASARGATVLVAEKAATFGSETSSRNSEVIHAGIYYPPGSLKAQLCREGKQQLYSFAARRGVGHRRTGKLIVATEEPQLTALEQIVQRAEANAIGDLTMLASAEIARLEPALRSCGGLLSPSTGIIDSHGFMLALLGEAEAAGAVLATHAEITGLQRQDGLWKAWVRGESDPVLTTVAVVNAAGLGAGEIGRAIEGYPAELVRVLHFAKGSYYSYAGPVPFRHLVYPVPEPGGLGIHLTLDLAGRARFGPDVEWRSQVDYSVDQQRKTAFVGAIARYWPGVDPELLAPDFAGVRPKLAGRDGEPQDFVVETVREHGLAGLVNLYGIESPGLTSALPLGALVADVALDGRDGPECRVPAELSLPANMS